MDCLDKKVKVKIDKAKEARKSIASLSIAGDGEHIVLALGGESVHASCLLSGWVPNFLDGYTITLCGVKVNAQIRTI